MNPRSLVPHLVQAAFASLVLFAPTALAQTGTLDQSSPWPGGGGSAWFNGDASSLTWQAQVRVGIAGRLEGVNLQLSGNSGAQLDVRLRIGDGWNTSPIVYQTQLVKQTTGFEFAFVDASALNLAFNVGDTFVIEMQGNNTGCGIQGSYVDPATGPALYAEPLFLGGPGCFAGCGWRIGFDSYMLTTPAAPVVYCTGGTTMHGCVASIAASANPRVGHNSPCQITVSNVEGQRSGILFYGLTQLIQPWCAFGGGSSFLCVKTPTQRTLLQATGGTINQCNGTLSLDWNAFQTANPSAFGAPWGVGEKAYVQGWFRDPGNCKPTSMSNAVELTYTP